MLGLPDVRWTIVDAAVRDALGRRPPAVGPFLIHLHTDSRNAALDLLQRATASAREALHALDGAHPLA
jgi:hypothetical protein